MCASRLCLVARWLRIEQIARLCCRAVVEFHTVEILLTFEGTQCAVHITIGWSWIQLNCCIRRGPWRKRLDLMLYCRLKTTSVGWRPLDPKQGRWSITTVPRSSYSLEIVLDFCQKISRGSWIICNVPVFSSTCLMHLCNRAIEYSCYRSCMHSFRHTCSACSAGQISDNTISP